VSGGLGAAAACWARSLASGGPRYLLLHVNSVCNAKCRMCFTWQRMMDRWDPKGLPLEAHVKIAASLRELPQLTVSGGEPLLRDDLPDILRAYYERARTRFFTVPTNALSPSRAVRLVERFLDRSPGAYLNFCLPFHGSDGAFDDVLGVTGARQRFLRTYALIQELRASRPNLSSLLNFVISRFNFERWREIVDLAREQFPESPLGISLCRGRTHEENAGEVPIEAYEAAQRYLASRPRNGVERNPYALVFDAIPERIGTVVAEVARGERTDLACGAGRHFLVIYDDGTVHPCEMLEVVGVPCERRGEEPRPSSPVLGNLHDYDFDVRRLLESARARATVGWVRDHACACTWESAIYAKIVHSPAELVRLGGRVARRLSARAQRASGMPPEPQEAAP